MKPVSIPALFALLLPACSLLPESSLEDPALAGSKYAQAHQEFLQQPDYQTLIYRNDELLAQLTPDNARIEMSLSKRRAQVLLDDEVAIDTPVSPGRASHPTPTGTFKVTERIRRHHSNLYGKWLDAEGAPAEGGDRRKIAEPPGGSWQGTAMPYWMRLTDTGIGMHAGPVPNYAASHGCIRLPKAIAPVIYAKTRIGTPVAVNP